MSHYKLSVAEREFIEHGAEQGFRSDGRSSLDLRPVTLETGVLPNASGSARVRIGKVTDILVGIKPEVTQPLQRTPDEGILSFSVECSSLASPDFVGRGAADLNAQLVQMLSRLYASDATRALRQDLCLIATKKCWVLHIDALVLDSGGNLFGALSLAVRAALRVLTLPGVVVIEGEADEDDDIEIDEEEFRFVKHTDDAPVAVTLSVITMSSACSGTAYFADCTSEEETCACFAVTVGVNRAGRLCGAVSSGNRGIDVDRLMCLTKDAARIGVDILQKSDHFLTDDIQRRLSQQTFEPVGFFA